MENEKPSVNLMEFAGVVDVPAMEYFKKVRSNLLEELETLFNEIKRHPEAVKAEVFGSKKLYAEWKQMAHDLQKLEDRQSDLY